MAAELYLKLGLLVSSPTVRKYWPWGRDDGRWKGTPSQRWATFVRNHADAMVAYEFMAAVTAKFQLLYVFVMLELGSRRILQCNVTAHPCAEWTLLQFREGLSDEIPYRFVIHDRDRIFSTNLQELVLGFAEKVLKSPQQSPKGNAFCERRIGTIRRECLDFMIPRTKSISVGSCLNGFVTTMLDARTVVSDREFRQRGHGGSVERSTICTAPPRKLRVICHLTSCSRGLHHEYAWERRAA